MDRALWLLMALQFRGWLRFLGRSLRTVKGAALALLGAAVFTPWLYMMTMSLPSEGKAAPENVLRFGPPLLLAMTLLSALMAFTAQRAISFNPAELNFLFPGPFSRRQLLAYKLILSLGIGLLTTPLVALAVRHHAHSLFAAWVGLVLMLMFLQFFATALALLASVAGSRAYNRSRKSLLLCVVAATALAVFWAGKEALYLGWDQALATIEQSPVWSTLLTPFRWFVEAFLAERFWPDLVFKAGRGLAVNLLLLLLIFALDARYLEAAAAHSERVYAQRERMRTGGLLASLSGSGRARFSLPSLPWWGGIGPTLWRQLLNVQRGPMPLVVLAIFYTLTLLPILATANAPRHDLPGALILVGTLGGSTIFLTSLITYDFRTDIDMMEPLKMLPLRPGCLVVGQLAAPVLLVSFLQLAALTAAQVWLESFEIGFLLLVAVFALPFNFLVFGIENLLFLYFPTRLVPATPGDFQLMGRHILLMIAKLLGIQLALVPAVFLAGVGALLAGLLRLSETPTWLLILSAGWLGLAGMAATLVPLLSLAFLRFDIARDTPP